MNTFPDFLTPENGETFAGHNYERVKACLRQDLYDHIISHNFNEYFALDRFRRKHAGISEEQLSRMVSEIILELGALGWTCTTSFGASGLFVYSGDPPPNCFPDGL